MPFSDYHSCHILDRPFAYACWDCAYFACVVACSKPLNFKNVINILHCPRTSTIICFFHLTDCAVFAFVDIWFYVLIIPLMSILCGVALSGNAITKFPFANTVSSLIVSYLCILLSKQESVANAKVNARQHCVSLSCLKKLQQFQSHPKSPISVYMRCQ